MNKTIVTAAFFLIRVFAFAQDTHYGTYQFGTRAALLGGAVVGGTRDNAMIVYNPAVIAFIDSSSFSINANLYQIENIHIKNILTQERDFKSLQLTSVPLLTSGQFKTKIANLRISYGIFSPAAFQFRGQARIEGTYPVVADNESPGSETFVGDENLFSRLREVSVALGLSYKLSAHWSVGVTNIFDERSQYYNRTAFTYYYLNNSNQSLVSTSLTQSFNYFNVRYMPKFGVAYRGARWSVGATATPPSIRMLGTGAVGINILGTNVKDGTGGRSAIVANGRQTKLKSYFKSPFSVAAGFQLLAGNTRLFFSATYFGKQGIYTILRATEIPFVRPAAAASLLNSENLMQVKTAARPVLNLAIGLEQPINERLIVSAGLRTNRSYYDRRLLNESGITPDITTWDLYHLVGGVTIRKMRSSMSLGLAYAIGSDNARPDQNLPLPEETNFFKSPITNTQATYNNIGVIIGYNYFFRKG